MSNTVLITGASRGIGSEAALRFAKAGYKVGIHYNKSEGEALRLAQQISASGGICHAVRADVSSGDDVKKMVEGVRRALGHIDILINNAGIAYQALLTDTPPQVWEELFKVNVTGMYHCTRHVLPFMLERHEGRIINVSSVWGMTGASCEVAYSATKAAVIGFTKALAKEVAPSLICVNCIAPGVIDTDMNGDLGTCAIEKLKEEIPLGRLGTVKDVAGLMLFLASDEASYITGQIISPNGGFVI